MLKNTAYEWKLKYLRGKQLESTLVGEEDENGWWREWRRKLPFLLQCNVTCYGNGIVTCYFTVRRLRQFNNIAFISKNCSTSSRIQEIYGWNQQTILSFAQSHGFEWLWSDLTGEKSLSVKRGTHSENTCNILLNLFPCFFSRIGSFSARMRSFWMHSSQIGIVWHEILTTTIRKDQRRKRPLRSA